MASHSSTLFLYGENDTATEIEVKKFAQKDPSDCGNFATVKVSVEGAEVFTVFVHDNYESRKFSRKIQEAIEWIRAENHQQDAHDPLVS